MDLRDIPSVIYPPNRPLKRRLGLSEKPVLYDYLFFVDINEKGELIGGCSNITGSYWENVILHYKDASSVNTNNYSNYYIGPSTSPDAKFVRDNQVVLAEDSSCLKLLTIKDNGNPHIFCEEVLKTNELVQQLSVWSNINKVLACTDVGILIADLQCSTMNPIQEFNNYHTHFVKSVDVNKNQSNLFASASLDRKACVWDDRMDTTASVLYQNKSCGLTSVSWNKLHPECLTVGSESGDVYSLDMRQPKEALCSKNCFTTSIRKIVFNDSGYLAVCGENSDLFVLNGNDNYNIMYESNQHNSFVRGLVWYHETLYSCGFDKQIIMHVF